MSTLQERTKTRLREVLAYLDREGGTSSKHDVMEHLSSWTDHEAEELDLVSNGSTRWENAVLWATTDLVKALWMNKDGSGTWTITDLGRDALAKYSNPPEFAAEANRLYYKWLDGHKALKLSGKRG
jgi:restriction endonuclease Mrr